jgi:hypothetical protein
MAKLITAKEAFALSNFEPDIDGHIAYINHQIKYACKRHENQVRCDLWDCSGSAAVAISARLRAAGYHFSWTDLLYDRRWVDISWGES